MDAWRRTRANIAWGAYLVAAGRFEEAEPILLQSRKILEEEVGRNCTSTRDAGRRLVDLYAAWGRSTEAARWNGIDA